jgi:hypothetical protein
MFTPSIVLLMIINTVAASGAVFVALQASALDTGDRVSASTASAPHATGITAELPDLDEKDVSLEIANGVLSISGEKKSESEDKARRFTGRENRTMLSAYFQSEQFDRKRLDPVDAFSLSCPGNTVPYYFITLDRSTKVVVLETEAHSILPGNMTSISDNEIRFAVGRNPSEQYDLLWDERSRSLTSIGIPNDPTRPTKTRECIVTKARSILELYRELARWR